ncbi:MAG: single-stranded DNA-binding protein [Bacillota bacterium]|nr:single-stranded DNA-binding protein [Bacillota bacterium]
MNNIVIHGRLVRDPEAGEFTTKKGDKRSSCKFTVAVDRRYGEETDFFNCVCFGKLSEVIVKFFGKGSEIVVSGEMQCNPYEKDGVKRYPWNLVVGTMDFCGSKKDKDSSGNDGIPEGFKAIEDEDVPF